MNQDPDPHLAHLVEANRAFADQIKTADQKAAYVFTFLVAFLVWSSEARRAFAWPELLSAGWPRAVIGLVVSLSLIAALTASVLAVLPRRRAGGTSFLFWAAWPRAGESLREARERDDRAFLFDEYMDNTRVLAEIARAKFRLVHFAFLAILVAILAYVVGLTIRG